MTDIDGPAMSDLRTEVREAILLAIATRIARDGSPMDDGWEVCDET